METTAINWTLFSITLAALFCFGICYALLVNLMARQGVSGQTAYMVVFGVTVALLAALPTFGLVFISMMFAYFAACGIPMIVEYAIRIHMERKRDAENAAQVAMEALTPTADLIDEQDKNDGQA